MKTCMTRFLGVSLFLLSGWVLAESNLDDFHKRFEFLRDDGGRLIEVRDRSMARDISIQGFVQQMREWLERQQNSVRTQSLDQQVELLLGDIDEQQLQLPEEMGRRKPGWLRSLFKQALDSVGNQDMDALYDNPRLSEVLQDFQLRLKENYRLMGMNVVARPYDKTFFYSRNLSYQVVLLALKVAKQTLSEVPLLNLATVIIVEYERLVRTRRLYHQNMFLHYLERFDQKALGLSKEEADGIFSSVYESRIAWLGLKESRKAQDNWERYGSDAFYSELRSGSRRLLSHMDTYDSQGERLNFAFQDAMWKGERVIVNLINPTHQFTSRPSVAYYYDAPDKVKKQRLLCVVAQLGLGFVPLSAWIKDWAQGFVDSIYKEQALTEGALAAHFAATQNEAKEDILLQALNPFLQW